MHIYNLYFLMKSWAFIRY